MRTGRLMRRDKTYPHASLPCVPSSPLRWHGAVEKFLWQIPGGGARRWGGCDGMFGGLGERPVCREPWHLQVNRLVQLILPAQARVLRSQDSSF